MTVFGGELWEWQKADQETIIGGLSNVISGQLGGGYIECYVVVPADFYRYFASVHPGKHIADVTFYLQDNGAYTFGYSINNWGVSWRRNGLELVGKGTSGGGSVDVDSSDCAFYPTYTPSSARRIPIT